MGRGRRWRVRSEELGSRRGIADNSLARASILAPTRCRAAGSQAGVLHGERCRGCAAGGGSAGDSVLRAESGRASSGGSSITSSTSTPAAARPIRACSATTGSSSASCSTMPTAWGRSSWRRGIMRGARTRARSEGEGAGRLVPEPGAALLRGRDAGKDQSYVLFGVRRELLRRMLLPVGGVREAGHPADGGGTGARTWPRRRIARRFAS